MSNREIEPNLVTRNMVVWLLSTPDETQGSINDPREREEDGIHFNEKWIYNALSDDPAGARMRIVYWLRYDFAGSVIRSRSEHDAWVVDRKLVEVLSSGDLRLYCSDRRSPEELETGLRLRNRRLYQVGAVNQAAAPSNAYRPVSQFKGAPDLGGHLQTAAGPRN